MIDVKDYNSTPWKDLVYYDETSPTFLRWKVENRTGRYSHIILNKEGSQAGHIAKDGYVKVKCAGIQYMGHRVVCILENILIEDNDLVDHIDGNRSNNKTTNLRIVTHKTNLRNAGIGSQNKTGVLGVCFDKSKNRYLATWRDQAGKHKYKGFSLNLLKEDAFRLACEYRLKMLMDMNASGAGYSDRHIQSSSLTT